MTAPACSEICDNGIDDDGDGLIDCADPDCGINIGVDTTICLGDGLLLDATLSYDTGQVSYDWLYVGYTGNSNTVYPNGRDTFYVRTNSGAICSSRDTIIVDVQGLHIGGVIVSDCYDSNGAAAGGNSVVDVRVMVDYINTPPGDMIEVTVTGATSQTFNPATIPAPHILTFTVPANGANGTVTANFVNNANFCSDSDAFTVPNGSCVETPCVSNGGVVWHDLDNDGNVDPDEVNGFENVTITAEWDDCAGNSGTVSTTTDHLGQYNLTGIPTGAEVRISFGGLPANYSCTCGATILTGTAPDCQFNLGLTDCVGAALPAWMQKGYSVITCLPGADQAVLAVKDVRQMGTIWDTPTNRGNNQASAAPTVQMWTIDQFDGYKVNPIAIDQRDGSIYVGASALVGEVQHQGGFIMDTTVYGIIYKIAPDDATPKRFAMVPGKLGVGSMDIDHQHNLLFATDIDGGKNIWFRPKDRGTKWCCL